MLSPRDNPKHAQFRPDELAALMAEATAAGLPVMAHAQAADGIKNAVRAGVRSIEHGIYLDDEAIDLMLAGRYLAGPDPGSAARRSSTRHNAGRQLHDGVAEKAQAVIAAHASSFARAVAAGVKIAMGTDTGVGPQGSNLDELPLMAAGGMTPAQVLTRDDTVGGRADGNRRRRPARSCRASARTWSCWTATRSASRT